MKLALYAGEGEVSIHTPVLELATLRAELPGLAVSAGGGEPPPGALRPERWRDPGFDFWAFDRRADELAAAGRPLALAAQARELPRLALEVATRCQRLLGRRNPASAGPLFDRALARHREAHDLDRPLARADYDHSLDVWQWVLRLDPEASAAVQLAALFHDVERLASAAEVRSEPGAEDYGRFKEEHARQGAELAVRWLAEAGVDGDTRRRVERLIAGHEKGGGEHPEAALLADADALSFFSLNSPGYVDCFGPEATRRKVAWTLARMSGRARRRLPAIHLRADVAGMLQEAEAGAGRAVSSVRSGAREDVPA